MSVKLGPIRLHWRDECIDAWLTFTGISTRHRFYGMAYTPLDTEL